MWHAFPPNVWESLVNDTLGGHVSWMMLVVGLGGWAKQFRGCYSWLVLEAGSQLGVGLGSSIVVLGGRGDGNLSRSKLEVWTWVVLGVGL